MDNRTPDIDAIAESHIESAEIAIDGRDWTTLHSILTTTDDKTAREIKNDMTIEATLEYDAFLKEKAGAPPADSYVDELPV